MKTLILLATSLLVPTVEAGAQQAEIPEIAKMKQITRIAASNLPGDDSRVVFASEDSLASMHLRHWIVTIERYPEHYRTSQEISPGAPCSSPGVITEVCSIQAIPGEPLFRGTFEMAPELYRFAGSNTDTAHKFLAFREQLQAHPEWTQAQLVAALTAAGAKYGPDKKNDFMATLPRRALQQAFGPMRLRDVMSMRPVPLAWPTYWRVTTILVKAPKTRLVMYFEPFEGKLQLLHVSRPSRIWDAKSGTFRWKYADDIENQD